MTKEARTETSTHPLEMLLSWPATRSALVAGLPLHILEVRGQMADAIKSACSGHIRLAALKRQPVEGKENSDSKSW